MTKPTVAKAIEGKVKAAGEALPIGDTLKLMTG